MNLIKTAWLWLGHSSSDSAKFSLSLNAIFADVITYGTVAAGFANINLPFDLLTQLFDAIVTGVQACLMLISVIVTIVGFVRKIVSTVKGTNQVLNSQ